MRLQDVVLESRFNALIISKIFLTVLANLAAAFRIGFRLWWIKWPGADDVLVGFAAVANTAYVVTFLQLLRYSLKIQSDHSLVATFQKFLFATIITYVVANNSVKFSILAQSRRIFVQPRAQRVILIIMVYLGLYGTAVFLVCIMTCVPVDKFWHAETRGRCLNRILIHYIFAIINIFNDLIILIGPLIFIKDLQVSRRTKLGITGLFACGGLSCIFSALRAQALFDNQNAAFTEQAFKTSFIGLWSSLETNVAIICACIPSIRRFLLEVIPQLCQQSMTSVNSLFQQSSQIGSVRLPDTEAGRLGDYNTRAHNAGDPSGNNAIKIHCSFEMRAVTLKPDGSHGQSDLISGQNDSWRAVCSTDSDTQSGTPRV